MTPARPITTWAIFVGTVPSAGRTSICNIPGHLRRLHRSARPGDRALLPDRRPRPASPIPIPRRRPTMRCCIRWRASRSTASGPPSRTSPISAPGHYQTYSATANKSFGDIDVRLMARLSHLRQYRHRGQPRPAFRNQHLHLQFPQLSILAVGTDRQRQGAWTTSCNGPRACSISTSTAPMTAACFICSCPAPARRRPPAAGRQFTITDWSNNSEENSSYAAYAQATYSIWSDTRFTAGVRYTYDERYAHIATQSIRTPATAATNSTLWPTRSSIPRPSSITASAMPGRAMSAG